MFRQIFCTQLKTLNFTNVLRIRQTANSPHFANISRTSFGNDSLHLSIDKLCFQVEKKSKISENLIQNVLKDLNESKVDMNQSLNILRNCANGRFYNDPSPIVNGIWDQLKRQNVLKIQHYTAMMQFFQKWNNSAQLQAIFDEMVEAKIRPNALAYNLLLDSYCCVGNIEKATDVWETMISQRFHDHVTVYDKLIKCHIIAGQIDTAKLILMEMKKLNCKVNVYILHNFLVHYTKENDIENIKKTFDSFAEYEVSYRARDVMEVMYQLSKNSKQDRIDDLMDYLKPLDVNTTALRRILFRLIEDADASLIHAFLSKLSENLTDDAAFVIETMVQIQVHYKFFNHVINNLKSLDITMEKNFDIMKPALNGPSVEFIWEMLHFMKSKSFSMNENHFDQLLSLSTKKGRHHLLTTVKKMCSEFGVQPKITIIRDIIIPGLDMEWKNIRKILKKLQEADIRYQRCIQALLSAQLNVERLDNAVLIASDRQHTSLYFGHNFIVRALLQSYGSTKDINAFVQLVKIIQKSVENYDSYKNNDEAKSSKSYIEKSFIDRILETAAQHHSNEKKRIEPLLREFEKEGFSLTSEQVKQLRDSLGNVTTECDALLNKLSSGNLKAKPIRLHCLFSTDSSRIKNRIADLEQKGNKKESSVTLIRDLYNAYLMEGNLAEANSLIEKENLKLRPYHNGYLIKAYVHKKQLKNALDALKKAQNLNKSFKLQSPKLISHLVSLMIDSERSFNEIEAILIANENKNQIKSNSIFENIFSRLESQGNVELLNKLHEAAVKNGHINATPSSTKYLVKVHLMKNNINEAIEAYKRIGQNYKILPLTVHLMDVAIKKMEFGLLEDVYRTSKEIRGNHLAASYLALAYIKSGRIREAEFIFNDNQIENVSMAVEKFCKYFQKYDYVDGLKTLLKATKNVLCNQNPIYETLLNIYCEKNDIANAMHLWQEYEADMNKSQSKLFESKLKVLMKKNDIHLTLESLKDGIDLDEMFLEKQIM